MRFLRVASLTLAVLVVPLAAFAQTTDVAALMAQIAAVEQQIAALSATVPTDPSNENAGVSVQENNATDSCPALSRTLSFGSSGSDVSSLQVFLIANGFLHASATGYFGNLTQSAVSQWQESNGVLGSTDTAATGLGIVGPRTRAAIAVSCGGTQAAPPAASANQCLAVSQPQAECPTGWQPVDDAAGCPMYYQCTIALPTTTNLSSTSSSSSSTPTACPVVQKPVCSGTVAPFQTSASGCVVSYQCVI